MKACKQAKDVYIEANFKLDFEAQVGDVVYIGDTSALHFAAVVSNVDNGKAFLKYILKNKPFKSSATRVVILFNSKYNPPNGEDTIYIYRTKTTILMVIIIMFFFFIK